MEDEESALGAQIHFWDDWNLINHASSQRGDLQLRQLDWVRQAALRLAAEQDGPLSILDFGCGTGWLGASLTDLGEVTGTDLAAAAIEHAKREFPKVRFLAGGFMEEPASGPFDLLISSEVIAHVADQPAFMMRVADLLRPGGVLLLMTQNGFVWRRYSQLKPAKEGQLRNWPSLRQLRSMLTDGGFENIHVRSLQPSGDRGVLRVLNSRSLRGGFKLVHLGTAWRSVLERALVGRDLAIVARRR